MGRRRTAAAIGAAFALLVVSACGGSGTNTQSFSPSPTPLASSTESTPPHSSSTRPSRSGVGSPLPTPTVTPPAQGAVDAYVALANAYNEASRDPAHADLATINRYLSGRALALFDQSIRSMKGAGQAYRGTPADPRVQVETIFSPSSIFLTSCPLEDKADPFIEYYIATGKPVPVATRKPPPPFELTLPMRLIGSNWRLADFLQNTGKTCSP